MREPGFLLDTNVLSELMRPKPALEVLAWFERQQKTAFHVSSVTRAEIFLGIALLPTGKRRDELAIAAERMFAEDFPGLCLAFDDSCATKYAELVANRTQNGQPITTEDAQIAATALSRSLTLATRNTKDFTSIDGLVLADPWSHQ